MSAGRIKMFERSKADQEMAKRKAEEHDRFFTVERAAAIVAQMEERDSIPIKGQSSKG